MKLSSIGLIAGFVGTSLGHAIFQKVSVNGTDQGQLKGVRAPDRDYPIQNVNDGEFACSKNIQHKDGTTINAPAGARVGAWWGHVIGGAQYANDPDNPIAASHKGLQWFKVAEQGLNNGVWAVNDMIRNGGWHYFNMLSSVAAGDYLMRVELLALYSAGTQGEAQFYMECAQIRITGSGSNAGSNFVSFPGAYFATQSGILINIYDNTGKPNGGGKPYSISGPHVLSC